jgi:hypothetical protein
MIFDASLDRSAEIVLRRGQSPKEEEDAHTFFISRSGYWFWMCCLMAAREADEDSPVWRARIASQARSM